MKIKEGFWVREVGGANIAVPLSKEARTLQCIVNLNASGALLFELLQHGATMEQLTQALLDAYDAKPEEAARAAECFVRQLTDAHLMEEA